MVTEAEKDEAVDAIFAKYDNDGSGTLNAKELKACL
jgi:hypothetical protein